MSTLTATKPLVLNDIVTFAPEVGWPKKNSGMRLVITKVPTRSNEKNFIADPCDADGNPIPGARGFKGPAYAFVSATDENAAAAPAPVSVQRLNPPIASIVKPLPSSRIPDGFYVVIGETDHERVRIMLVGGDHGRYWRAYSKHLVVLDPAEVAEALALV